VNAAAQRSAPVEDSTGALLCAELTATAILAIKIVKIVKIVNDFGISPPTPKPCENNFNYQSRFYF